MPNTVPNLTGAGSLPDTLRANTGKVIESDTWNKTGLLQHYGHANGQVWRASQSWPGSVCQLGSNGQFTWPWRIPLLSSHHVELRCYVEATLSAGTADVKFTSSAGNVLIPITSGAARAWYTGVLAMPSVGGTDDVVMSANALSSAKLTVHTVSLYFEPLSNPLPTTVATSGTGSFVPVGDTTLGADRPLASGRVGAMANNCTELYRRVRPVYVWVGLHDDVVAFVGKSTSQAYAQVRPYLAMPRMQLDDVTYTDSYKISALVLPDVSAARHFRVALIPEGRVATIDVPAGAAIPTWVSGSLDLSAAPNIGGVISVTNTGLNVSPVNAGMAALSPHTDCHVYAVIIYGV